MGVIRGQNSDFTSRLIRCAQEVLIPYIYQAPVAQRIEHLTTDQKVRGSNPCGRTLSLSIKLVTVLFLIRNHSLI